MKSSEELQQDYITYLDYVRCGKYGFIYDKLDSHSIEELETLANFGWNNDDSEDLYGIFIRRRKRKMNTQFVFNKENMEAITDVRAFNGFYFMAVTVYVSSVLLTTVRHTPL